MGDSDESRLGRSGEVNIFIGFIFLATGVNFFAGQMLVLCGSGGSELLPLTRGSRNSWTVVNDCFSQGQNQLRGLRSPVISI